MPYELIWAVPKRVLLTTFTGAVSKTELEAFINQIRTEIPKGEPPIYHISNSLAMGKVEVSPKVLFELIKSVNLFSGLRAQIDINRPKALNAFLANVGGQVIKLDTRMVQSVDEAIDLVGKMDAALLDVPWNLGASGPATGPETKSIVDTVTDQVNATNVMNPVDSVEANNAT